MSAGKWGIVMLGLVLAVVLWFSKLPPVERVHRSMVQVQQIVHRVDPDSGEDSPATYTCTGFVINASKGEVLTAGHCDPGGEAPIYVDGQEATIERKDERFMVLKLPFAIDKPPVEWGRMPEQGDQVMSLGIIDGHFVALKRNVAALSDEDIVTDGPINPGMSGGPTITPDGKVVGINQGTTPVLGVMCGINEIRKYLDGR